MLLIWLCFLGVFFRFMLFEHSGFVSPVFPSSLLLSLSFPFNFSLRPPPAFPWSSYVTASVPNGCTEATPMLFWILCVQLCYVLLSLVPVVLPPKGNSYHRQWAAYRGKQQPSPCQPATKAQREKRRMNVAQYWLLAENQARIHKAKTDTSLAMI